MKQNRIVIDITTLRKWRRFPVGIVRTQLEFTKYCLANVSNCRFVYFDDSKSNLIEANLSDVSSLIEEYNQESWKLENQKVSSSPSSISESKIGKVLNLIRNKQYVHLVKAVYARTPVRLRGTLRKHLEPILRRRLETFSNPPRSISDSLFSPESVLANNNSGILGPEDTLVCMGLDWDFSNYSLLLEMKKSFGFKVATCFYDAIPISYPELVNSDYFGKIFFAHMYKLNYLSDKVFCISNFSKKSYIEIAQKTSFSSTPDLRTIYLGDDVKKTESIKRVSSDENYVLYVSTIEVRKNHILLLKVWDMLIAKYGEDTPRLKLVGMKGWGVDEFDDLYGKSPVLKKFVDIQSNVSDAELAQLYRNSKFCVFPSIVEGWGLGAAESLSYGKVCLVSDCEALAEATQGLMPALRNDPNVWFQQITKLIDEPSAMAELASKVEREFEPRTWREFCADFHDYILEGQ